MNALQISLAAMAGALAIASSDIPDKVMGMVDDSVVASRMVTTAGDLHSISVMLDASYVMDRYLPEEEDFFVWLAGTFKRSNVKDLALDYWGHPYIYTVSPDHRRYQLRSAGPDGTPGNDDDMVKTGP